MASGVTSILSRPRIELIQSAAQPRSRRIINRGKRLKVNEFCGFAREHAADVMPIATHGDGGGTYRAAKIEREDLGVRIAAKLERHQRQQHRFAGAGRSDHQRMADIADVK